MTRLSILMLVLTLVGGVATAASEPVQHFWAAHASISSVVLMIWAKVALFMPRPSLTSGEPPK